MTTIQHIFRISGTSSLAWTMVCLFACISSNYQGAIHRVSAQEFIAPQLPPSQLVPGPFVPSQNFSVHPPHVIPLAPIASNSENRVQLQCHLDQVTLVTRDAPLFTVLSIASMGTDRRTSPSVQGRMIRVFTLNYILASDVDKVVKGLMSPLGQSFTNTTNVEEQRNAHEQLVVEDLPAYLDRIADYIAQVDTMPRQVVVEANIQVHSAGYSISIE